MSINVEDGVLFLRGVVNRREDIERLEAATRRIREYAGWRTSSTCPARRRRPAARGWNATSPTRLALARAHDPTEARGSEWSVGSPVTAPIMSAAWAAADAA